jgi:hypothetical protein
MEVFTWLYRERVMGYGGDVGGQLAWLMETTGRFGTVWLRFGIGYAFELLLFISIACLFHGIKKISYCPIWSFFPQVTKSIDFLSYFTAPGHKFAEMCHRYNQKGSIDFIFLRLQ